MKNKILLVTILCSLIFLQGATFVIDASKNAVSHNQLGLMHMRDGYYFAAIEEFKLAIKLSPNSAATATFYNNLGLAYSNINQYNWAIVCFQKAISINPNFLEYYQNLVKSYKSKKVLNQVVYKYTKNTKQDPSNSRSWLILGLVYKELGHNEKSAECLEKFLKLEPDLSLSRTIDKIIQNMDY